MKATTRYTAGLFVAAATMAAIYGCNDEAARFPGEPEVESKYSGAEEAEDEVGALYRTGAPAFYGKESPTDVPAMCLDGFMSGLFDGGSEKGEGFRGTGRRLGTDGAETDPAIRRIWEDACQAMRKAGEAIENVPRTGALSGERRDRLEAEARFFRAFNCFYLVRHFGKAPPADAAEAAREVSGLPGADVSEAYGRIVEDLKASIRHLPDSAFTENRFRVGRPAAETLLADVYLTMSGYPLRQDNYRAAAEMARRVIRGGRHRLASNGDSEEESGYGRLRTDDRNPEYVYSYRTDGRDGEEEPGEKGGTPRGVYMPTGEYLNAYDSVYDLRMHEHQFFHTFRKREREGRTVILTFPRAPYLWMDEGEMRKTGDSRGNMPVYRYAEVLLMAAEAIANAEGVTPEAAGYLADVRARAYARTDRTEMAARLSGLGKEEFIGEVWLERMREFPFEMKVWTDIQRTRKYPVTSAAEKGSAEFVDVAEAAGRRGIAFEEKRLFWTPPAGQY